MKLNDDLFVLAIPIVRDGQTNYFNLSLIVDANHGATLVDTGLPGQHEAITSALAEAGLGLGDLRRIILTHQDVDHIGSLHELAQASGARVLAHQVEAPYIDGTATPRFATAEVQARFPTMRALAERFRPTPIDQRLSDGERLDLAGGVRVVFSPGHTPGHTCLYLERSKTLIAGDALTAEEGRLNGPNPSATADMPAATESVRRLAELDVRAIVCYHGGVVADDAAGQLGRVAAAMREAPAP